MISQFPDIKSQSSSLDIVLLRLSSLVSGPSFMSIPSLVLKSLQRGIYVVCLQVLPPIERNKCLFLNLFREKNLFVVDEKQQHQISKNLIFLEVSSFQQKEQKILVDLHYFQGFLYRRCFWFHLNSTCSDKRLQWRKGDTFPNSITLS